MGSAIFSTVRRARVFAIAAACLCAAASSASAQDKVLRLVVPFPPGGGIDVVARLLQPKIQASTGETVVVDNKPGGSGFIGTLTVAKAKPDGQHLLMQALGMSMNPSIYKKLPYDSLKDIEPVALIGVIPVTIAVGKHLKANTLKEFVALAKASPGKLKGAAFVTGSAVLMLEMFNSRPASTPISSIIAARLPQSLQSYRAKGISESCRRR